MSLKENILKNPWFYAIAGITVGLLFAGLILPPPGQIHSSVLTAAGILSFWGVLGVVLRGIEKGVDAEATHGDLSIKVKGNKSEQ